MNYLTFLMILISTKVFANQPSDWQISFQEPASALMRDLVNLHDFVFWIITAITLFVFFLLVYVCIKFSAKNNKTPSMTTHNSLLEVAWTLIPEDPLTAVANLTAMLTVLSALAPVPTKSTMVRLVASDQFIVLTVVSLN